MQIWVSLLASTTLLGGCSDYIKDDYGESRGHSGKQSVNGTAALVDMFEQAGCKVRRWSRMSPRLQSADVIVWIPDSFSAPSAAHRRFVDEWLQDDAGRTLIYVGRDFDAAVAYWDIINERAKQISDPKSRQFDSKRRIATTKHTDARDKDHGDVYGGWFVVDTSGQREHIKKISGPWATLVTPENTNLEIGHFLETPTVDQLPAGADEKLIPNTKVLLSVNEKSLIQRVWYDHWDNSQIIVVSNGSFLLNLPLVNHEHRKLAAKLIDDVVHRDPPRVQEDVVFLVSSGSGPKVHDTEPTRFSGTGLKAFLSWPLGAILLHLFGWGLIFCVWKFPIFGKPETPQVEPTADFGQHVTALGHQLQRTGNLQYAQEQLAHYHRTYKE